VHYHRLQRRGLLDAYPRSKVSPTATLLERMEHIGWTVLPNGCWVWKGWCSKEGYPRLALVENGHYREKQVARLAYEHWFGPIPDGAYAILQCGTAGCMAPAHITIKSMQWHMEDMRAESLAARVIQEQAKSRRYRLSPNQIHEVDTMLRTARLGLLEGRLTQAESSTRCWMSNATSRPSSAAAGARTCDRRSASPSPAKDAGMPMDSSHARIFAARCTPGPGTAISPTPATDSPPGRRPARLMPVDLDQ
jgi:hypothetical protein